MAKKSVRYSRNLEGVRLLHVFESEAFVTWLKIRGSQPTSQKMCVVVDFDFIIISFYIFFLKTFLKVIQDTFQQNRFIDSFWGGFIQN